MEQSTGPLKKKTFCLEWFIFQYV